MVSGGGLNNGPFIAFFRSIANTGTRRKPSFS